MQTLLEILQKTTAYLAGKGVPNPKLNAELLLAHALRLRRLDLYLQFDRPMQGEQLDALRPLVQRRGKREPLEYIIGSRPFVDIELLCDRRALVPRSETEELVELLADRFPNATAPQAAGEAATCATSGEGQPATTAGTGQPSTAEQTEAEQQGANQLTATEQAGAEQLTATDRQTTTEQHGADRQATAHTAEPATATAPATPAAGAPQAASNPPLQATPATPQTVLDLGTGTGALALALAKVWPQARVTAVDASADALALAQANAIHNGLEGRVQFVAANWFTPLTTPNTPKSAAATNTTTPTAAAQSATASNTATHAASATPKSTTAQAAPASDENTTPPSAAAQNTATPAANTAPAHAAGTPALAHATGTPDNAAALAGRKFDLIVSNPPYLTEAEWQVADPEVKDHEPYGALVAAEDGLADLRTIVTAAPAFLASGGLLALETGIAHHEALAQIAAASGAYARTESHRDSDGRPRFFLAVAK